MKDFDKLNSIDIIWCHWDLLRFLSADKVDLNKYIVAVGHKSSLKDSNDEVIIDYRIYLYKESDKFIIQVYISDTEYDILEYVNVDEALENLDMLPYNFPKYKTRPMRVLNSQTLDIVSNS